MLFAAEFTEKNLWDLLLYSWAFKGLMRYLLFKWRKAIFYFWGSGSKHLHALACQLVKRRIFKAPPDTFLMINVWTPPSFLFFAWPVQTQLTTVHSPGDSGQDWKPKSWFLHPSGIGRSHTSCFWLLSVRLGYGHISVAYSHLPALDLTYFSLLPGHLTLFLSCGILVLFVHTV